MLWPNTSATTTRLVQVNGLSEGEGRCKTRTSSDWLRRWLFCVFLMAPPTTASYVTRRGWSSTIALSMPAKAPTTKWQLGNIFCKVDEVRWFETRGMCGMCSFLRLRPKNRMKGGTTVSHGCYTLRKEKCKAQGARTGRKVNHRKKKPR